MLCPAAPEAGPSPKKIIQNPTQPPHSSHPLLSRPSPMKKCQKKQKNLIHLDPGPSRHARVSRRRSGSAHKTPASMRP